MTVLIIGCADCIFRIFGIFYEPLLLLIIIIINCFDVNYQMRSRYISLHLWTCFTELYRLNAQWRILGTSSLSTCRQFSLKYETHLFFEYFERCVLVEPPIVPHFLKKDDDENNNNIMVAFPMKNDNCRQVSRVVFA